MNLTLTQYTLFGVLIVLAAAQNVHQLIKLLAEQFVKTDPEMQKLLKKVLGKEWIAYAGVTLAFFLAVRFHWLS
jgi:hypothetical protein